MIKSAVTISLVQEARGGPFVFWDDLVGACAAARELGFDSVEVFPPHSLSDRDALSVPVNCTDLRRALDDNGLKLAAVGTGAGWVKHRLTLTAADEAIRRGAQDFIRSIVDFAGPFGAPAIIGSMQGRHGDGVDRDTALESLREALDELGEHAKQYGVPLIYEPLNRYETNLVSTVADGVALLRSLSTTNVKLLADLFHMNIEEADIAAAIRAGGSDIGHVHFVDSNRRPAGCGHIDYAPIAAALREINYAGYASAEALPWPDSHAAAKQTIETFRRWFPR